MCDVANAGCLLHNVGVVTSYLADENQFIRDEAMLKLRNQRSLDSSHLSNTALSPLKPKKSTARCVRTSCSVRCIICYSVCCRVCCSV